MTLPTTLRSITRPAVSRRGLLTCAGGLGVALTLAACSDTGADGKAVASSTAGADYDTAVNSGPVAADDVVAASTWASAIKKAGKLRIGGSKTARVFSIEDPTTHKVTGFDAAIGQALARYIIGGDRAADLVEITQATSDTRETLLTNGTVDTVIATYTITEERAQKISFAGPYYSSGQAVAVHKDTTGIASVTDLAGKTVAVQSGSSSQAALAKACPDAKPTPFDDNSACLSALQTKQVDAYVVDESLLLAAAENSADIKIVGQPFTEDPYGLGLPKDSDAQAFVNGFLTAIEADGTWTRIWQSTIGAIIGGDVPQPPVIGSVAGARTAAPAA
ncbi:MULTISPECIES: glutamate ABC transporter substrate-binding protein [Actinomyces]|uniref:Glutamate ABC transporter substrate-binding protein n=1 Tax=Actinomyces marmotae TaxID=2737173 RepID=A0A6M8B225_9ACTO|nr:MULTISPECIES: glutamate ABC transporter substrate-binding protein [Actinomyces]QKD79892.1 glutamate ABC transporter substrate-binding protein [Actinomyces marmotae]